MGESIVDAPIDEDKMEESAVSDKRLEVSVSFGRFENDALSWEKWSSFSQNKYLEEVEKCSTPGSVAQKKAYFEAHYKKIAARKMELLDQEKQMETAPLRSDGPDCGDLVRDTSKTNEDLDTSNSHGSTKEPKQEANLISEIISSSNVDEPKECASLGNIECQSSSVEGDNDCGQDNPKLDKPEVLLVEEETPSIGPQDILEIAQNMDVEIGCHPKVKEENVIPKVKEENVKLEQPKESRKITPADKEKNVATVKKKPVSPLPKKQISTPRVLRPTPSSTMIPASRTLTKKETSSSLPQKKNPSAVELRRAAPTSLHMSLSLGPTNSDPACITSTRKSLIMEKMGDKDIVKRAFKTFQNSVNQLKSSSEEKSSAPKQVSRKGTEPKVSTSMTRRKEIDGSQKAGAVDQRNGKAASSSFGLRSNERAEKRKEYFKKLDEKSSGKETEKMRLRTKPKEEKESEMKNARQSLHFKAMPGFHRGQRLSKSLLDKEGSKNEIHR